MRRSVILGFTLMIFAFISIKCGTSRTVQIPSAIPFTKARFKGSQDVIVFIYRLKTVEWARLVSIKIDGVRVGTLVGIFPKSYEGGSYMDIHTMAGEHEIEIYIGPNDNALWWCLLSPPVVPIMLSDYTYKIKFNAEPNTVFIVRCQGTEVTVLNENMAKDELMEMIQMRKYRRGNVGDM